jgi:hypothetical protein
MINETMITINNEQPTENCQQKTDNKNSAYMMVRRGRSILEGGKGISSYILEW